MPSFEKFLNKKIVFVFVIFLILIAGGFFWWWQNDKEIKGSPEDYVIKETEEGRFVENKKAGLVVKVPEGWEAKKIEDFEGSIAIDTLDIDGGKQNGTIVPPLIEGCGMEISMIYKEMNFEQIKEEIKAIHWGLSIETDELEEITINNHRALKNTFNSRILGPGIAIYIPKKNKIYDFDLYWASDEKERCIQEFDKFLETVSIQ